MDADALDDLPDELRPPSVRTQAMRFVGVTLVLVGALMLAGAGVWWTLAHGTPAIAEHGHHLSLAVVGGGSLLHGLIAVVTVETL